MANSLISILIIPKTEDFQDVTPLIEEAIALIEASGLRYNVQPLETTIEGELTELLYLIKLINNRMVELGSINVMTQVKILYEPTGITMETFMERYH